MEEVKYKVWYQIDDKMYDVKELYFNKGVWRAKVKGVTDNLGFYVSSLNSVLRQYIGIKDKNGKEIYEGDVVKFVNHNNGKELLRKVSWNEETAGFQFNKNNGWNFVNYLKETNGTMEIVGNIYQNPGLVDY